MTESQLKIAVAFVTELISLGVLALVPHGVLLVNVYPLLSFQTRTIRPVEMHFRHEEGIPKPIMCSRPIAHDFSLRYSPAGVTWGFAIPRGVRSPDRTGKIWGG
jgi:hypothetical protein